MTVLGFSSSAVKDGNVERMVKTVLAKSGRPVEFIRLPDLSYSACRSCVHLCAGDNLCRLEDDLKPLYPKIQAAEALVFGTPVYFDTMNGFMTILLERLWAFRHQRFPLANKPFFVVSAGNNRDGAEQAIRAVCRRMSAYRGVFAGSIAYGSTIFPCYTCGVGHKCKIGAFYEKYGAKGIKDFEIVPGLFKKWEDSPDIVAQVEKMASSIAERA